MIASSFRRNVVTRQLLLSQRASMSLTDPLAPQISRLVPAAPSLAHCRLSVMNNTGCPLSYRYMTTDTATTTTIMPDTELNKRLSAFQDLFVEARMSIEDVVDSAETTYFDEEVEAATQAVEEAVQCYGAILDDIQDEDQKNSIRRSNGLKVEQLKGELELAVKGGHH